MGQHPDDCSAHCYLLPVHDSSAAEKQNEIKKFREGIKAGDRVVTAGGIYGKVRSVGDNTFDLEIAKDVRITIDKGSVYPSAQQAAQDAQADNK